MTFSSGGYDASGLDLNFGGDFSQGFNFGDYYSSPANAGLQFGGGYNPAGNSFLGNMSPMQAGVVGLGSLSSAFGAFNGYKQTKLAKQQLAFQKDAFNKQWGAQRNLTNSHLEDRQKQRVARDPNAMSVAEYMNKYGI